MELWKPIKNYENLYDASNYGRVRSLDHYEVVGKAKRFRKGRILKPCKKKSGYLQVGLCKDGKHKWFRVHRLVWEAFNGEIPDGYEINHIDENTENNSLSNLSAVSHKTNINWGTRNQRCADKCSQAVLQLTYPGLEFMCEWSSTHEAGRNGFSQGNVAACCRGERKSHKGFTFRYKETYSV